MPWVLGIYIPKTTQSPTKGAIETTQVPERRPQLRRPPRHQRLADRPGALLQQASAGERDRLQSGNIHFPSKKYFLWILFLFRHAVQTVGGFFNTSSGRFRFRNERGLEISFLVWFPTFFPRGIQPRAPVNGLYHVSAYARCETQGCDLTIRQEDCFPLKKKVRLNFEESSSFFLSGPPLTVPPVLALIWWTSLRDTPEMWGAFGS